MKSFKVLIASLLTPVLILSSPGVLAQEKLIETVPRFYYLEEPESGEAISVHVCHGSTSLNPDCEMIVEIAAKDLEKFIHDLEHKIDVANAFAVIEHKSKRARKNVGHGLLMGWGSLGVLLSLNLFREAFLEKSYVGRHSLVIGGLTSGTFFLVVVLSKWEQLTKEESEVIFPYSIEEGLLAELDRGVVAGTDDERHMELRSEIMQLFTDFLNEFGRPVSENS